MKTTGSGPGMALVMAGLAALSLGGCKGGDAAKPQASEQASAAPTAPSSEWVAENPTEPAVPVDLPKTPMTGAPAKADTNRDDRSGKTQE